MEESINVVKFGTYVITKMGKINAIITGVCVRDKNITYEISYFSNGTHIQEWVYRIEFDINETEPKTAGFNHKQLM